MNNYDFLTPLNVAGEKRDANKVFTLLYSPKIKMLYLNILNRKTSSLTTSEEIFQQASVNAFKGFDKWEGNGKFTSWYHSILKNVTSNHYRKAEVNRTVLRPNSTFDEFEKHRSHGPDVVMELKHEIRFIYNQIQNLSPKQRSVLEQVIEGDSYGEIAKRENVPVGTVASRLSIARKKIYRS